MIKIIIILFFIALVMYIGAKGAKGSGPQDTKGPY